MTAYQAYPNYQIDNMINTEIQIGAQEEENVPQEHSPNSPMLGGQSPAPNCRLD
jgi:hypothetical protein